MLTSFTFVGLGVFIYQAIAFFLLGSWKEAIRHETDEVTPVYIINSILAAAFWPLVVLWYVIAKKR